MTVELVVDILSESFFTVLIILLPVLGVSMIIGLIISIFQAVTSIHEMTLTFVPKIIITGVVLIITMPWMAEKLMSITIKYFNMFSAIIK